MSLNDDVKGWLTSKTVWGGIIAAVSSVLSAVFKLEIPVEATTEIATSAAGIAGGLLAIYGRVKAVKKIK
jgi:hypothetical protein